MNHLQKLSFIFGLLLLQLQLHSQNFNNLDFGTEYTLDIVTWNTEWFPSNGSTTIGYVEDIVKALDAEIIAFQEIDSKPQFQNLIDRLDDYEGYYISNDSYQGLAYLYHKDRIQILDQYEIYTSDWNEFPRSPLIMEFRFENKDYIIINNHLKCCGDGILESWNSDDEEGRRYWACKKLDAYIEDYFRTDRVILLGDLNDELTDNEDNNVFKTFLNDESNYLFTDMHIAEGGSSSWSYPTWPSHLDHILITNELFSVFNEPGSSCEVIKVDEFFSSWNSYENNVSDHRPVGLKLQTKEIGIEETAHSNLRLIPNPFLQHLLVSSSQTFNSIKVFNNLGNLVFEKDLKEESITINTTKWPAGIYYIQVFNNQKLVSARKSIRL